MLLMRLDNKKLKLATKKMSEWRKTSDWKRHEKIVWMLLMKLDS